ncbi:MAG: AAA family ATPase [Candidatus Omnitrophica bacterium]|nr:AAA family ATPase [Candidatus Omnitrophota bacterium]
MLIKKIKVSNFKSFEKLDIELGRFNVLIGSNASGKSNFLTILKFLKDMVESGLDNAISMQGGVDYIRNINIGDSKNLSVELHIDSRGVPFKFALNTEKDAIIVGAIATEFIYQFGIEFPAPKESVPYRVVEEQLIVNCGFVELEKKGEGVEEKRKIGEGDITLIRDRGTVRASLNSEDMPPEVRAATLPVHFPKFSEEVLSHKELFIESTIFFQPPSFRMSRFFRDIFIYDFDPKLPKEATQTTGKTELEHNGRNLAIILKNILDDKKKSESMFALMKDLLPFIEGLTVERLVDKSLLFGSKEVYSGTKFLPAYLMSDGTINITALIIALYFEENPVIAIEEPERNIHPHLISKIVDMMKDVSERFEKQIIVTTHNPEMVKYAGIENILLVHRDDNGFSQISRPSEKEEVRIFIENEMGIEELYVQNLLEW